MRQIIIYKENRQGKIAKFIDGVEVIDGEVVNEGHEHEGGSFASRAWAWFFSSNHNQTVGGNEWEKKYKHPTDGNRREWNPTTGEMEYTVDTGANRRPTYYEQTLIDGYGDSRATDGS
jgi:hypothetical protein